MPRYVNNPLIAKVHVIDANGDPVTGATVQVKVLDPNGQDWDGTWNANYYSDGVYYTEITPDESGDWTFIFTCSNPKFSKAIVFYISDLDVFLEKPAKRLDLTPPVQSQWYTVCDLEGMLKVYKFGLSQVNDGAAMKNFSVRITVDGRAMVEAGVDANSGNGYSFTQNGDVTSYAVDTTDESLFGYYSYAGVTQPKTFPQECKSVKIEVCMNSAAGSNQALYCLVQYAAKGIVIDNLD
jgi:YtkA-like